MDNSRQNPETTEQSIAPYKSCLNCGAELNGKFCHNCGQEATGKPSVKAFILAYLDNAFLWDSQFFKTFWTLLRHPGRLTKDYNEGKHISQEHPLKLNMFLLFIFVSLFLLFASNDKMTNTVNEMLTDERFVPLVQMEMLMEDPNFVHKMNESPRDTIQLRAPLIMTEEYSDILLNIKTLEDTNGEALDKWEAVVPHILIEDKILITNKNGEYQFDTESGVGIEELELVYAIWADMTYMLSQYFPMLLLLTVPFLTFSLSLVLRHRKLPLIHHFIFSLHYTALLESLIICIYLLYLTINPPMEVLEYILLIGSCLYLTVAYHKAYTSTWWKAILKSLLTSLIYITILAVVLFILFFIACFSVAFEMI